MGWSLVILDDRCVRNHSQVSASCRYGGLGTNPAMQPYVLLSVSSAQQDSPVNYRSEQRPDAGYVQPRSARHVLMTDTRAILCEAYGAERS
jgi:hypothetical protein